MPWKVYHHFSCIFIRNEALSGQSIGQCPSTIRNSDPHATSQTTAAATPTHSGGPLALNPFLILVSLCITKTAAVSRRLVYVGQETLCPPLVEIDGDKVLHVWTWRFICILDRFLGSLWFLRWAVLHHFLPGFIDESHVVFMRGGEALLLVVISVQAWGNVLVLLPIQTIKNDLGRGEVRHTPWSLLVLEIVYFVVQLLCRPCITRASLGHQFAGTSGNSVHTALEKSPVNFG